MPILVAIGGRGKRGGVRTLIAYQFGDNAFFIYGFAKNQKANVSPTERRTLQVFADDLLEYDEDALACLVREAKLIEVIENE